MPASIQTTLGKNFDQLAESFSPALTGGVLNHIFQPITEYPRRRFVLKTRDLTVDHLLKTVKQTILHSEQSTEVLDVLPFAKEQKQYGGNHYLVGLVVAVLAILLSLGIWIALIIFPICMRRKLKSGSNGGRGSIRCYRVFTAICLVFILASVLLTVFGLIATAALGTSLNPSVRRQPEPGERVSEAVAMLVKQVPLLFNESIESGIVQSRSSLERVHAVFDEILKQTIPGVINDVLQTYNVKQLVDDVRQISTNLHSLSKEMAALSKSQLEVLANLNTVLRQMNQYRTALVDDLAAVCPTLPPASRVQCQAMQNELRAMDLSIDTSQIDTNSAHLFIGLNDFLNELLSGIGGGTNEVDYLLDRASNELLNKVSQIVDLSQVNDILDSFWTSLRESGGSQLKTRLEQVQPQVKTYNKLAYTVVVALGTIVLVISLLMLIFGCIYVILYTLSANDCQTCLPSPVILTVVYAICGFILFVAATFGVLVPILSWAHNDVCRYVSTPPGSKITDYAINLWLDYEWPRLLQRMARDRAHLIQQSPPQNVFTALTSSCGNSPTRGLLSLIGLNQVVNVDAVFQLPVITDAIQNGENTVLQFVRDLNISSRIPNDLENNIQQFRNLVNTFDKNNYRDQINRVRNAVNTNEINRILEQLDRAINAFPANANTQNMRQTIDSIRLLLSGDYSRLQDKIDNLIAAFDDLSSIDTIRLKINSLTTGVINLLAVARDPIRLTRPIVPLYRKWTSSIIRILTKRSRTILSHFFTRLFPCRRLYTMIRSVINVTCGKVGEVSLLGSFSSLAVANTVMVLTTMLLIQIFVYMVPRTLI